jgi:tetratricopeptide (TPR) repeat protein
MALFPRDLEAIGPLCAAARFDEALKLCGEFIAEHRDHPHGYHMRAVVRTLMGEPGMALADRDKVVSLCPQEPGAYMARADDQLRIGDFAAAAADLARAEKYDHGHYWPMIPLLRGYCLARLGRFAEALGESGRVPADYLLPGFDADLPASRAQLESEVARLRLAQEKTAD